MAKDKGLSAAEANRVHKYKSKPRKVSISDMAIIERQYYKANKQLISYGQISERIANNADCCVVCGDYAPEGTHICARCQKL